MERSGRQHHPKHHTSPCRLPGLRPPMSTSTYWPQVPPKASLPPDPETAHLPQPG